MPADRPTAAGVAARTEDDAPHPSDAMLTPSEVVLTIDGAAYAIRFTECVEDCLMWSGASRPFTGFRVAVYDDATDELRSDLTPDRFYLTAWRTAVLDVIANILHWRATPEPAPGEEGE